MAVDAGGRDAKLLKAAADLRSLHDRPEWGPLLLDAAVPVEPFQPPPRTP
jgi:hypothetical protein